MKKKAEEKNIGLLDIVDLKFLQEIQDAFAKSANVASLIVDCNGPVTQPSNFTDFCIKYTRGTKEGYSRCNECDINWGKLASEKGEPVIYDCHLGLTDFTAPIMLNGKHIASIYGGQILTHPPDIEHFKKIARELNINEDEYIEALKKISIIPLEQVKAAAELMYIVANTISELAHKKYEFIKKIRHDNFLNKAVETIRSSADIDEIENKFVNEIGKMLDADRVFISRFNPNDDSFMPVLKTSEYLSSPDLKSVVNTNVDRIKGYGNIFKTEGFIEFSTQQEFIQEYKGKIDEEFLYEYDVKSGFAMPILYMNGVYGVFGVHFTKKNHNFSDNEKTLIKILANQTGIALYQTELMKEKEQIAENESTLRRVMLSSSSTFNFEQLIQSIVSETGKLFGADRCFFIETDVASARHKPIQPYAEYLSSPGIVSHTQVQPDKSETGVFINLAEIQKISYVENIENIDLPEATRNMLIDKLSVKSYMIVSVKYDETIYGAFVLHYVNKHKKFSPNDISMAEAMANQSASVINQVKTYDKMQKTVERERILRRIIEITRSSLDIKTVKEQIVNELGKAFNADRCYFRSYDKIQNKFFAPDVEYLSSPDIKSLLNVEPDQKGLRYFSEELRKRSNGFYPVIANEEIAKETPLEEYMKSVEMKADYAMPIIDNDEGFTWLVLHYSNKDPEFDNDYKKLLETIAFQVDTALEQIKLYNRAKQQVDRELLLRKISENMRSFLDINSTLTYVCDELARVFNVQRATIIQFHENTNSSSFEVRREYKINPEIKGIVDNPSFNLDVSKVWAKALENNGNIIAIDNIQESDMPDFFKENYANIGQKSIITVPIKNNEVKWGVIILSEYNYNRHWSAEEKNLLTIISNQIYISIQQSELYSKMQQQIEREKLLRNITETIRVTHDIDKILSFICTEAAKLFNVQRAVIVEFSNEQNDAYTQRKEYKSRDDIQSFTRSTNNGYEKNLFLENDLLVYDNISTADIPEGFKKFYESAGLKSAVGSVVKKGEKRWGAIILFEYDNHRHWNEDEITLLKTIADQIYISITQAGLYSAIKQQAEREKAILSNLPFMVWLKDKESRFLAANELFATSCGTTPDNIVGKTDFDFWPEELAQAYVNDDIDVMQKGVTKSIEEVIQGKNGQRWHETYKTPLFDERGEVIGTTGFSRDITERREVDKIKNEFVSTVSHELRTPLTSLSGAIELILGGKMGETSDKIKSLLNMAHNNCFRLTNLINDILDIEKIEAGKMDFEIKTLELMPLINQAVQLNLQFAQKFNVEIKLMEVLSNVYVQVDSDRLIQVLTNLLSNAIKFSEPNANVELSSFRVNDNIRISVTNYGAEIPQAFKNKIFQKFAQADSSDSRQKGGTGLGLNISKLIVEKMNGQIDFVSENNKTTFFFDLPEFTDKQRGIIDAKTSVNM